MKIQFKSLIILASIVLFTACASTKVQSPKEVIIGKWNVDAQGMSVVIDINETQMEIMGMGMTFDYKWAEDNKLALSGQMGNMTADIAIIDENQFTLTSAEQGTQIFDRVEE
ncbi:hypothetical protein NBRC116493_13270 [Aurantivibrio infirmus]